MGPNSKDPNDRGGGRRVFTKFDGAGSTGVEYSPFSQNRNDNVADLVVITVGRLADRSGKWVALDTHSLIYAELTSHHEAIAYAQQAAAELARDGFRVTIDDCGVPA